MTRSRSSTVGKTVISGSSSHNRVGVSPLIRPLTGVTVATLLRDLADSRALALELIAGGAGVERRITIPQPQKTGLALSGFDAYLKGGRVLVFGESEIRYVESLAPEPRRAALARVFGHDLPCVLVTGGFTPAQEIIDAATAASVPLLVTTASTPEAMTRLSAVLDTHLAARGIVHGVLMDILGLGLLVVGESGIGKSECALDLVVRGHRLVADDTVELRCRGESYVHRLVPGVDAASHGDPRARPDQHPGPVRRRVDTDVQTGRARRPIGEMGTGPRVRSARHR